MKKIREIDGKRKVNQHSFKCASFQDPAIHHSSLSTTGVLIRGRFNKEKQ